MEIGELIERLRSIQRQVGDLPVAFASDPEGNSFYEPDDESVEMLTYAETEFVVLWPGRIIDE